MDENKEQKMQYILDEKGDLAEIIKSETVPVEYPIKYKLKNAFEVFVRVKGTENYWISNYGRCVNNMNRKDKDTFYEHKQGNVHYTVFEIVRCPMKDKRGRLTGEIQVERYKRDTTADKLVAETFLKSYPDRKKIWHKDGDESNNWYKNLLYVTPKDYIRLKDVSIIWKDLNYDQEYIEYENKASHEAMKSYNAIKLRCADTKENNSIGKCYDDATMRQEWLDDPKLYVRWYLEHYYEVEGESMAVDKDLFGNGSKIYSPQNCCILPQGLNTLLTNCKKHYYLEGKTSENTLPLGVRYNRKTGQYYGEITFTGSNKTIKLSAWDTKEEAFAEYKIMKQADILLVAAKYKEYVPDYIYEALLKVQVEPY